MQKTATSALLAILSLGLFASPLPAAPAAPDTLPTRHPHRFLISDSLSQKLLIFERDGSVSWEYPQPGSVYDGAQLPDGNVLYCWFRIGTTGPTAGVREITPDKRIVFEFSVAQECHSVQRLSDGLTLIEDPSNRRLIEVDRQGRIVRELKLQIGHREVHHVARQCRKLPDGNYLVAQEFDQAVVEYAPDGSVRRRFPIDGRPFGVSRLPNGHTLIGTGGGPGIGRTVVEIDSHGNPVWTFEPADFPAGTNLDWVLGAHRLANGHTVIANFLGHGKGGQGLSLLEVTPSKEVVWTFGEKRIVLFMQILEP
jgi:hypothetical protein